MRLLCLLSIYCLISTFMLITYSVKMHLSRSLKYFSLAIWDDLSFVSRKCWRDIAKRKNSASWFPCTHSTDSRSACDLSVQLLLPTQLSQCPVPAVHGNWQHPALSNLTSSILVWSVFWWNACSEILLLHEQIFPEPHGADF